MSTVAHEFHLTDRPAGFPQINNFRLAERELQAPSKGQLLIRNEWLSVDPYMRGRMIDRASHIPAFELNKPMDGAAIGVVVESGDENIVPGDKVSHFAGWRDYALVAPAAFIDLFSGKNIGKMLVKLS